MTLLFSALGSGLFFAIVSWSRGGLQPGDADWFALLLCVVFCISLASLVEWLRKSEPQLDRNRLTPKGDGKAAWAVAIVLLLLYTFVTWAPRSALL